MTEFEIFSKEEVTKILLELGIPANLQGFRCLKACILKVINRPSLLRKVTRDLYPKVGEEFSIDGMVVERSMRHSTEIGYNKTGFKALSNLFNADVKWNYKPTSSELIALIAEYIRFEADKIGISQKPFDA